MRAVKRGFAGEGIKHSAVKPLGQGHKLTGAKPELKLETLEFLEEASFAKRRLPVSPVPRMEKLGHVEDISGRHN